MATKRISAFKMSKAEQDIYKNAVTAMISDGTYEALVKIHAEMRHNMHDMPGIGMLGRLRFLPWHRAYLIHFEAELQKRDAKAFVPYWDWVAGGVPDWLKGFKPKVGSVDNKRNDLTKPITDQSRIDALLKIGDFPSFTHELELDPHNSGHVALGFPMERVPVAPSDPIFWMHHGQVDRVWAMWQSSNSTKKPILSSPDDVMDPWSDTVDTLQSIAKLGYSYA
jgi:tyrosinase